MIRFSAAQLASISQVHKESWLDATAASLARTHDGHVRLHGISVREVRLICVEILNTFQPLGFTTRRELRQAMTFGLALGGHFLNDPRIRGRDVLSETNQPAVRRIERFRIDACRFLDGMWQNPDPQTRYRSARNALSEGDGTASLLPNWQATEAWWQVARKRWIPCRDSEYSYRIVATLSGPLFYIDPVSTRLKNIFEREHDLQARRTALIEEFTRRISVLED